MSRIIVGDYNLEIISEPGEQVYDYKYTDDGYWTSSILLRIYHTENLLKSVLIASDGGGTTAHKSSFIIEPDRVLLCCSNSIFCLSIPSLELLWKTKADWATCFQIFKYQDDYIIHGELDISRLDKNGEIVWQQSGADIFVQMNSTDQDFLITDDHILATDWDGQKYKFDFDGNIID